MVEGFILIDNNRGVPVMGMVGQVGGVGGAMAINGGH